MTIPKLPCPTCDQPARAVAMLTVRNLARAAPSDAWGPAWFCTTADCDVVYFREEGDPILRAGVRVPVFQKETDPNRPVCYCFGHNAADIVDAEQDHGPNRLVEAITEACRRGLDRCEETNPQGRCCLGNVRGLVRSRPPAAPCC